MTKISHDSEIPAQGQQVITACAFIHHQFAGETKLFLPRRAATKKFLPSVLELPGGHIDFGEDIVEGLKREIAEEFGMAIKVGDPFFSFTYHNPIKGSHSIEVIYFATFSSPLEDIQLNPEDHSEYQWITAKEIPQLIDAHKTESDPEWLAIRKGFNLLAGDRVDVA